MMNDYIKHGKASIVIDGQFGSTGKGLAAAYQCEQAMLRNDIIWDQMICTTNAAPNAGHTTVLPGGRKFITFHMPTIAVMNDAPSIYLNAGAIIDMDVFKDEIEELKIRPRRIVVHPNAAIITKEDKKYEQDRASGATKIASTQKGVGRALARKIMREGTTAKDIRSEFLKIGADVVAMDLNEAMSMNWAVVIETPQGMGLSLNNGFHPHCTSREVSVSQSLSDAGVHPSYLHKTLMTTRTFPIRVGNIVDETGQTIGHSGGVYDDQRELSWEDFPQVEPERTTVTKRVRRIFTFSEQQYRDSIARLRPDIVHIGFCDYLKNQRDLISLLEKMNKAHAFYRYEPEIVCSFGPCTTDVVSLEVAIERLPNDA
jgi:adenylosuccinate synthase